MSYKYKTIDLCAGIGGIRCGFELTGAFENVLAAEIDPAAVRTYKQLFKEDNYDPTGDLTSEEFKKKICETQYDVLLAGFPCQTFSSAGKQDGFMDKTRGTIFFDIANIISRTDPRAIFLENVENLLSHDGKKTIETIIQTLEKELGYKVIGVTQDENGKYQYSRASFVRNTKNFGLPQNRPRVYIMAFSKKQYGKKLRLLTRSLPEKNDKIIYADVHQILDPVADDRYYMATGYLETLKRHRARQRAKGYGFGYSVVNQSADEHPIAHTILATGGSGKERNLVWQPKEGVAGKIIVGKKTPVNSEGIRVMMPTEWGRLQGFVGYAFLDKKGKDRFSFPEGMTDSRKYMQLGNSVSIPVVETMASFMSECLKLLDDPIFEKIYSLAEERPFTKREIMDRLDLGKYQAGMLLKFMIKSNLLIRTGCGTKTRYVKRQADMPLTVQKSTQCELWADNTEFDD